MQHIINFLIKNKNFILFLVLLSISLLFTVQSHSYHKSKFINSANWLSGGIYEGANGVSSYFNLKSENERLVEENRQLKNILYNKKDSVNSIEFIDSISFPTDYLFRGASITKNSYSNTNNILLINKGNNDSIATDMGVVNAKGIIGIVDRVSGNHATVISILNVDNSKINAQLKNTNHFGTLTWDGKNPNVVQLEDIEKLAKFTENDTIVTGGNSTLFPKGIPIGTVKNFKLNTTENLYNINVQLFNDMTDLEHVYVIENLHREEIDNLLAPEN
ncbi:cell shape-determining protein MreC [Kordia sp. SMS9]|uniref:rod shape-determining protein MreC n=1 Tax=Kordia sp. SMS9 TaxID=2282170 RepID=UPI000E0CCDE9|nr:rod shape-determining protein MreC [Kordia sp. SMS9]AXG68267.1 cell shape-determining protein MreC [Kordia sp. SMS9]